jgi:hypothetical protein
MALDGVAMFERGPAAFVPLSPVEVLNYDGSDGRQECQNRP